MTPMHALLKKEWLVWINTRSTRVFMPLFVGLAMVFFLIFLLFFHSSAVISVYVANLALLSIWSLPFVTMTGYSDEKKYGTLWLLQNSFLSSNHIWLAKCIHAIAVWSIMLCLTSPPLLWVLWVSHAPWSTVLLAYGGLFCFGVSVIGIGLACSFYCGKASSACFFTWVIVFFLWILAPISTFVSGSLSEYAAFLSIQTHLNPFLNQSISIQSMVFFASFLCMSYVLCATKKRVQWLGIGLTCLALFLCYDIAPVAIPWDMQPRLSHRLSWALSHVKTPITFTLYSPKNHPFYPRTYRLLKHIVSKNSHLLSKTTNRPYLTLRIQSNQHQLTYDQSHWIKILPNSQTHSFELDELVTQSLLQLSGPPTPLMVLGDPNIPQLSHTVYTPQISQAKGFIVNLSNPKNIPAHSVLKHVMAKHKPILFILAPFIANPVRSELASKGIVSNGAWIIEDTQLPNTLDDATPLWIKARSGVLTKSLVQSTQGAFASLTPRQEEASFEGPFTITALVQDPNTYWVVCGARQLSVQGIATLLNEPMLETPQSLQLYTFALSKHLFWILAISLLIVYPLGVYWVLSRHKTVRPLYALPNTSL